MVKSNVLETFMNNKKTNHRRRADFGYPKHYDRGSARPGAIRYRPALVTAL